MTSNALQNAVRAERLKYRAKIQASGYKIMRDEKANAIGLRIEELMRQSGKRNISSKDIVEDARNKNTPYHDLFEWDNSEAGEKYRIIQACGILSSIVKVQIVNERQIVSPMMTSVTEKGERNYSMTDYVIKRKKLMNQVIAKALLEAKSWYKKYKMYSELGTISGAIEETLEEFDFNG